MQQTEKIPPELRKVWVKYGKTKQQKYRDILIKNYMPLVKSVAEKLRMRLPNCVDVDDLVSAGVFGLNDAINLFDLKRNIKFETYCVNRIRGSMLDELRDLDWVPRLVRTKEHQLDKAQSSIERRIGRQANPYEVAKELKVSIKAYQDLRREASVTNILLFNYKKDISSENDRTTELFDLICDDKADDAFQQMLLQDLANHIKNDLSKNERLVLQLYFYDDLTMKEIGKVLEISESRVSQIFNSVIHHLRRRFKRRQPEWLT
jgi:RNA polymerase sigma factor for flagellar operon FliA